MRRIDTKGTLELVVKTAEDKKAKDLQIMDLQGRTLIADYFVLCSGTSNIHIRSIVDGILDKLADYGIKKPGLEGYSESRWVLIDVGDVVVHVFSKEDREFYDLESIWQDVSAAVEEERAGGSTTNLE